MAPRSKLKKKEIKKVSRFSSIVKSVKRLSWDEKMKLKSERKALKERDDKLKAERKKILEVIIMLPIQIQSH